MVWTPANTFEMLDRAAFVESEADLSEQMRESASYDMETSEMMDDIFITDLVV